MFYSISLYYISHKRHLQRLYHVSDDRNLEIIDELELEKDEDAPMSMTAHPEVRLFPCLEE